MFSFQFEAIGTHWQIDLESPPTGHKASSIKHTVLRRINEFDKTYSRFKKDSWVTRYSYKSAKNIRVPDDFDPLFSLYTKLYELSNGLFTPLIGATLEQAGYDKDYSFKTTTLTPPPPLSKALSYKEGMLTISEKVLLDFGAAGKGYLVDLVAEELEKANIVDYCIDASGDILSKNTQKKPLRVGLEHPDDPTIAIGVCELVNKSICGSAGNRRKWGTFHHTINPFTLSSPDEIKATWVIADNALLADALATCLFLDPHIEKYKDFKFECVLLYKDNTALRSPNFSGELFTEK